MEFNAAALEALAKLSSEYYQKEGVLTVIEKLCQSSPRLCRLMNNLLFTFSGQDLDSELYDVTVLENFSIHTTYKHLNDNKNSSIFPFVICINSEDYKAFITSSEFERLSWISAFNSARRDNICLEITSLSKPISSTSHFVHIEDTRGKTCEISLCCENLPCDIYGRLPNCMVRTDIFNTSSNCWQQRSYTEIIEKNSYPVFQTLLVLGCYDSEEYPLIRFTLLDVKELFSKSAVYLDSVTLLTRTVCCNEHLRIPLKTNNLSDSFIVVCSHRQLEEIKKNERADLATKRKFYEDLCFSEQKLRKKSLSCMVEKQSILPKQFHLTFLLNPSIHNYCFRSKFHKNIFMCERMNESSMCFIFPQYLLEIWIKKEKVFLRNLLLKQECCEKILVEHLCLLQMYIKARKSLLKNKFRHFKRSSEKSESSIEFAPTNLHLQKMSVYVSPFLVKSYNWITVGAFTIHSIKSENGGLKNLIPDYLAVKNSCHNTSDEARNSHKTYCSQKYTNKNQCLKFLTSESKIAGKQVLDHCHIQYRRNVCFSQALTSLVTGLLTKLWDDEVDTSFIKIITKVGPLACFECLLSLCEEDHMWEDMYVAIKDLSNVRFVLSKKDSVPILPKVINSGNSLDVHLPVPDFLHAMLPESGSFFHITPVLFTMGVNEMATMAETTGANSHQYDSNSEYYEILNDYYKKYKVFRVFPGIPNEVLEQYLIDLKIIVDSQTPKNIQVLHLSSKIAREMQGVVFVSCKSAKDRTGMFVTLDQTQILRDEFKLTKDSFKKTLDCIRSVGCRIDNVFKNIGVSKYAFNSVQIQSLPSLYRPPSGTYGSPET